MFDWDVAETHWDMPMLPWERMEDTMFLLALWDPHAPSLSLKESAHRILGVAPDEQDDLKAWILANVPEARQKPSTWAPTYGARRTGSSSPTTRETSSAPEACQLAVAAGRQRRYGGGVRPRAAADADTA